ncbi:uncharacterized protein LOC107869617 [Capsicum annuum]|uniref:uncharacterized protein LOC107869617 n=1 Tax=Capsicum annuum TaxID=4072 RepID=UPI0007BF8BF3|nr:uncharacterized protein LOC107869617 [Capsicum annuum]
MLLALFSPVLIEFPSKFKCNLSGWSTKGYMACPTCNKDASSQRVRVDIWSHLHRDDVDSITIDANIIELEAQTEYEVEVDYNGEDSDQEDDTMVEYISDHEENKDVAKLVQSVRVRQSWS